jgi:hypothetical protein
MATFGEKLAAARESRPTKDVSVILDGDVAAEKARLVEKLRDADGEQRLGVASDADKIRARLSELEDAASDALVTLRITRLPGRDWANLTSKNPVRVDSPIDRHYGYNIDAVTEAAVRFRDKNGRVYAHRIEDGDPVEMTDAEWDDLYEVLSGSEVTEIRDAVWSLSEWEPQQRVADLVKASGAATRSVSK